MSTDELIKEKSSYPYLEQLKITDPDEYRKITEKIILDKLYKILPHYINWQRRNHEFPIYESTLLNIREIISSFNYSKYDEGLSGKKELTPDRAVQGPFGAARRRVERRDTPPCGKGA